MKLGVLFSGGKDSCFACYKVREHVACLITIISKNPESYMFHTTNINLTKIQADLLGLPWISVETEGEKEKELEELEKAIKIAKEKYKITGIVSGALSSVYQTTRIKKICDKLGLQCVNPLWQANQIAYLKEFISSGFKALISGVFACPFSANWLGRVIDEKTLEELKELSKNFGISVAGEGGEFETFVFDGPIFKKKIEIIKASKIYKDYSGIYKIEKIRIGGKVCETN